MLCFIQSYDQDGKKNLLCVPSFLEVLGFRGIHEHPAVKKKKVIHVPLL